MDELNKMNRILEKESPEAYRETLVVVDAATGQNALAQAGIKLFGGCSGNADQAVEALLEGQLNYDADVKCSHHDHEHGESGHQCGNHGCGSHSCH